MITVVFIISIFLSLFYLGFILFLLKHWERIPGVDIPKDYIPSIPLTIIIPARNESQNISQCLESILKCDFPKNIMEIIVVDDQSTDNTSEIIKSFQDKTVRLLKVEDTEIGGKKRAIKKAITNASFDTIVQTDADVIVPFNWLKGIAYLMEIKKQRLITGPVSIEEYSDLLQAFQALEITGLMFMTGAGIKSSLFYLANGANMAYKKADYGHIISLRKDSHLASGDDVFLIQALSKKVSNSISFLKSADLTVRTRAVNSFGDFISQRIRWATKTNSYQDPGLKIILGILFLFSLAILINLLFGLTLNSTYLLISLGMLVIKFCSDYIFLKASSTYFGMPYLMKKFVGSFFFHLFYMVFSGLFGIFLKNYKWKGRKTS